MQQLKMQTANKADFPAWQNDFDRFMTISPRGKMILTVL